MPAATIYTFTSTAHPGDASWQRVAGRAFVRPFTVCILPIMIGALLTVLQGYPALLYLLIGFPVAILVAASWTLFRMQATVAEIHVRPGAAAVRSIWDCAHNRALQWMPIFELRTEKQNLTVALGDTTYELDGASWPDAQALLATLQQARYAV
jgi:hypothetical protein